MRTTLFVLTVSILGLGCGSSRYGYTETGWTSLAQSEREAVEAQALDRKLELQEEHRQRQFVYKPHNVYLGSRSNEYCAGCGDWSRRRRATMKNCC